MGLIANIIKQEDESKTLRLNATEFLDNQKKIRSKFLPAEWATQSGVQLTWPHEHTDWGPMLSEVKTCYGHIAREIALRELLLIITPHIGQTRKELSALLPAEALENVRYHECPTNDTWARDHAFITLQDEQGALLADFRFNGWGQKFPSNLDNQICRNIATAGILNGRYYNALDFTLEGGSIESDGEGTLLTTSACLMAPNRNEPLTQPEIEERLCREFNLRQVLWLDHGYLAGDDTDSHVDTLARLCPNQTITYVQCTDPADEHYEALKQMEQQLQSFRTLDNKPYRLLPLPMANPIVEDGERLPATYANFLILNQAVLYPTYNQPDNDRKAGKMLAEAFPGREIIGIDCRTLIRQHGSLHCVTMQYPEGVLK